MMSEIIPAVITVFLLCCLPSLAMEAGDKPIHDATKEPLRDKADVLKVKDLSETLEAAYDKAWKLVSGSGNLSEKARYLHITGLKSNVVITNRAAFRRTLQLAAMRASSNPALTESDRELADEVYSWNLNLKDEENGIPLEYRYVKLKSGRVARLEAIARQLSLSAKHSRDESLPAIEKAALGAYKWGIANCQEYSEILFTMLLELSHLKHYKIPMEIVVTEDEDHVFLIVNRDLNSRLSNPAGWGSDCYIVDPWWQLFGPVSKYLEVIRARTQNKLVFKPLFHGYVGAGHSSDWPYDHVNDFKAGSPAGEPPLLFFSSKKGFGEEHIPFAYENETTDLNIWAQEISDTKAGSREKERALNQLRDLMPWLKSEKPGLADEVKFKFMVIVLKAEDEDNIQRNRVLKDIFKEFLLNVLNDLVVQKHYSDQSLEMKIQLFYWAFKNGEPLSSSDNGLGRFCDLLVEKDLSYTLRNALEQIGIDFKVRGSWFNYMMQYRGDYTRKLEEHIKKEL